MLSSHISTFFPSSISRLGISFILATRFRVVWFDGMKERAQVGVYLATVRM